MVYVNGQRAGAVWCPPFAVSLDGLLRDGENAVRIDVANLAVNAMAGRALPDYRLLNQRYGVRFEPQDMDQIRPEPSGIMQPVYIRFDAEDGSKVRPYDYQEFLRVLRLRGSVDFSPSPWLPYSAPPGRSWPQCRRRSPCARGGITERRRRLRRDEHDTERPRGEHAGIRALTRADGQRLDPSSHVMRMRVEAPFTRC